MNSNATTGSAGEKIAEYFLRNKGYKVLVKNYRSTLGEIDLICLDKTTIVFLEVKSNTSLEYGPPELRVDQKKQKQILQTALGFLKQRGKFDTDCRFDVVSVLFMRGENPKIEHIENAFTAD